LCAVPLLLWARSAPLDARFDDPFTTLTSIAVLCAFAGTSAFALNLVLGARLRYVEALLGGLDRMYEAHRVNGQIAFALLLGHAVLILASRATVSTDTALDLLGPGAGWTVFAGVLAFGAMTVSIVMTLFVRLGHEVFVYVQRSFGFIFLVATYHVFTTEGVADESTALNLYMAALASLGVAAFVYRSLLGNVLVRWRPYKVTAVNRFDEFVTEIVMDPLAEPLDFAPGQFVFVNFRSLALSEQFRPFDVSVQRQVFSIRAGDVSNQFHPFSITSAPAERTLRITVKAVGDYTRALRGLEEGADAVVEGPCGSFSHRGLPGREQIWLAGGIGVTPFLSMARSLRYANEPAVDFYYCVESAEEAHFLDEFREVAARRGDFRVFLEARNEVGFPDGRAPGEGERRAGHARDPDLRAPGDDREPAIATHGTRSTARPYSRRGVWFRKTRREREVRRARGTGQASASATPALAGGTHLHRPRARRRRDRRKPHHLA
jgi:predicted ferric reductase